MLNAESRNICSVEDPAEIQLAGINQVNVREKAGLTFAVALRAFLRQDPDVIMVGEIRDGETADVAFKAAQTGHLVLSTLHTNDAPAAIARLSTSASRLTTSPLRCGSSRRSVSCGDYALLPGSAEESPAALRAAGFADHEIDGWHRIRPVAARPATASATAGASAFIRSCRSRTRCAS